MSKVAIKVPTTGKKQKTTEELLLENYGKTGGAAPVPGYAVKTEVEIPKIGIPPVPTSVEGIRESMKNIPDTNNPSLSDAYLTDNGAVIPSGNTRYEGSVPNEEKTPVAPEGMTPSGAKIPKPDKPEDTGAASGEAFVPEVGDPGTAGAADLSPYMTTQFDAWYAQNFGMPYAGGAWARPEGMADADYYAGLLLYNDYLAQNQALGRLQAAKSKLENERTIAQQNAAISYEKLKKYLPQQIKNAGMGNLGVSQSAYIRAANDYANQKGQIDASFADSISELEAAYGSDQAQRDIARTTALSDLERYYGERADTERKNIEAKNEESLMSILDNGLYKDKENLEQILAAYDGKVSDATMELAKAYLNSYDESDRGKAEEQSRANRYLSKVLEDGTFSGTPEELREMLQPYMDKASEEWKGYSEYVIAEYARQYEAAQIEEESVKSSEKDARILEGKEMINGRRITGDALDPEDIYGEKKFMEALKEAGYTEPYGANIKNGTTITVGNRNKDEKNDHYTYYNGEWYPSK